MRYGQDNHTVIVEENYDLRHILMNLITVSSHTFQETLSTNGNYYFFYLLDIVKKCEPIESKILVLLSHLIYNGAELSDFKKFRIPEYIEESVLLLVHRSEQFGTTEYNTLVNNMLQNYFSFIAKLSELQVRYDMLKTMNRSNDMELNYVEQELKFMEQMAQLINNN